MADMPQFSLPYLSYLKSNKKLSTAINQAIELRAFFNFIAVRSNVYNLRLLTIDSLNIIDSSLLDDYLISVSINSRKQKASHLNSFYRYLYKQKMIHYNPFWDYEVPSQVPTKKVITDNSDFNDTILGIASGLNLSEREATFAAKTQLRDIAIICLIYYANLSVSECYSINVSDIIIGDDLSVTLCGINDILQGKKYSDPLALITSWFMNSEQLRYDLYPAFHQPGILHLPGRDVEVSPLLSSVLLLYLSYYQLDPDGPLFYSLRNMRLSIRSIENIITKHFKRYANKHVHVYALSHSSSD